MVFKWLLKNMKRLFDMVASGRSEGLLYPHDYAVLGAEHRLGVFFAFLLWNGNKGLTLRVCI